MTREHSVTVEMLISTSKIHIHSRREYLIKLFTKRKKSTSDLKSVMENSTQPPSRTPFVLHDTIILPSPAAKAVSV